MKRRMSILLAGALAVSALAGCGSQDSSGTGEKVRLMVWSPSEDQSKNSGEWLQTCCEKFAEEHPEWDITFVYGLTRRQQRIRLRRTLRPEPTYLCLQMTR